MPLPFTTNITRSHYHSLLTLHAATTSRYYHYTQPLPVVTTITPSHYHSLLPVHAATTIHYYHYTPALPFTTTITRLHYHSFYHYTPPLPFTLPLNVTTTISCIPPTGIVAHHPLLPLHTTQRYHWTTHRHRCTPSIATIAHSPPLPLHITQLHHCTRPTAYRCTRPTATVALYRFKCIQAMKMNVALQCSFLK